MDVLPSPCADHALSWNLDIYTNISKHWAQRGSRNLFPQRKDVRAGTLRPISRYPQPHRAGMRVADMERTRMNAESVTLINT